MPVYSDGFYTVVANDKEEVRKFFIDQDLTDDEGLEEIEEVDPNKEKMCFPIDELPKEYHDKTKYPRKEWFGEYVGVDITLQEAMKYRDWKPPYILCVSSDVV